MKREIFIFSLLYILFLSESAAQKQPIDSLAIVNWKEIQQPVLTSDGKFVMYTISGTTPTLKVQSLFTKWNLTIKNAISYVNAKFIEHSNLLLVKNTGDSLIIIRLGQNTIEYVANVKSFDVLENDSIAYLAYQLSSKIKPLTIVNLSSGKQKTFLSVEKFCFMRNGNILLAELDSSNEDAKIHVKFENFTQGVEFDLFTASMINSFLLNTDKSKITIIVENKDSKKTSSSLWYYDDSMNTAKQLLTDTLLVNSDKFRLDNIRQFDSSDNRIIFAMKKDGLYGMNDSKIEIWSYADSMLLSQQKSEFKENREYVFTISVADRTLIRLENDGEHILINRLTGTIPNMGALVVKQSGALDEWNWNKNVHTSVMLVSLANTNRTVISEDIIPASASSYVLSPKRRFIIYFNPKESSYFSLELASGIIRNITMGVDARWTVNQNQPSDKFQAIGSASWLPNDKGLLIYDRYNIYLVDPLGINLPENLTFVEGKESTTIFRIAEGTESQIVQPNSTIILNAFDKISKYNGFYSLEFGIKTHIKRLVMQPCVFQGRTDDFEFSTFPIIKAKKSELYIVQRMTAYESPNLFYTSDFKYYHKITSLYPEKRYNWLTTELIQWQTSDCNPCQGILFKPENFDPQKKYPVIFTYYETFSDGLNHFIKPDFSDSRINIPYFVSNGYIVIEPDIHYKVGYPGQSALESVEAAVRAALNLQCIDSNRMGLQGHSFGAFETNYIITHSNIFTAACAASGWADYISGYSGIRQRGTSRANYYELGKERIGDNLWKKQNHYLDNSPILLANTINTPLLMMNNKEDTDVDFFEGIHFFTSLRRLEKKVWMLQYSGEGHTLGYEASIDWTKRMLSFFNYYLKGEKKPGWMNDVSAHPMGNEHL